MREILFKAKRLDNGEWVEGSYVKDFNKYSNGFKHCIFVISKCNSGEWNWQYYEIDPETLCQYTGLTDKNGNKIWENDIVQKTDSNALGWCRIRKCEVSFDKYGYWKILTEYGDGYWLGEFDKKQLEVIGNVFDDSELLEEN